MTGPLLGRRIIELAGIGPGPFAGMILADMGADVISIERPGGSALPPAPMERDLFQRGKRSVILDLKHPDGQRAALTLADTADALIEGFRPGVAERLGLGPDVVCERNPRLVYGRMTGWGQSGPLAHTAGHDVNYIALTGALHAIGERAGPPRIPLNLVGDFGGGSTYLVMGLLAAMLEAERTGRGQVIDAAIVDGTAHLLAGVHTMLGVGGWTDEREVNLLDGGAPFYSVYETSDGEYVSVGALEPKFYARLLELLGLPADRIDPARQNDRSSWSATRASLAEAFRAETRQHWAHVFAGTDACVAPVLSLREAAAHPHLAERGAVVERDGALSPGRAPRFSLHPAGSTPRPPLLGEHTEELLTEAGLPVAELLEIGAAVAR